MSESTAQELLRHIIEQECARIGRELAKQCPRGVGFALFFFEFGPPGGAFAYASNGRRDDVVALLAEFLERQSATMNPDTGELRENLTKEEAEELEKEGWIKLDAEEAQQLRGMNRHERRKWAAERRKKR